MLPYTETQIETEIVERKFDSTVSQDELLWHRDLESRIIEPLDETDWKIQIEDELPERIRGRVFIRKEVWHRLIKGSGELVLKIVKLK
jgi:hypothetical protein